LLVFNGKSVKRSLGECLNVDVSCGLLVDWLKWSHGGMDRTDRLLEL
jgi:hypothetical protein